MTTSIVVPVYQRPDVLETFLVSLLNTVEPETEIIFVNDGSGSNVASLLHSYAKRLDRDKKTSTTIIEHQVPHGCGQSINDAFEVALGDTVILADSDLILRGAWQRSMEKTLKDNPNAGMTGSVLVYPQSGGVQHAGIRFSQHVGRHWRLNARPEDLGRETYSVQVAAFALFGMTRSVLSSVGSMDDGFMNGYEDFDFQMRAREFGFETIIDPTVWSYHWERRNGPHRSSNKKGNLAKFWGKWGNMIVDDSTDMLAKELANQISTNEGTTIVDICESRFDAKSIQARSLELIGSGNYNVVDCSHLIDDGSAVPLALTVPASIAAESAPIVFFVENFVRLLDNHMWIERRLELNANDSVVDLYGNSCALSELAAKSWPGTKVR